MALVGHGQTGTGFAIIIMKMKKTIFIAMLSMTLLCVITQLRGISHAGPAGVAGSRHDMSVFYLNAKFTGGAQLSPSIRFETEQVCVFCHTPHNANVGVRQDTYWENGTGFVNANNVNANKPYMLWNRDIGSAATTSVELYKSATMTPSAVEQVWPLSLMCLSCHDGVSAINVLHNNPGDWPFAGPIDPEFGQTETRIGDIPFIPANIGDRWPSGDTGVTDLSNDHPVSIDYNAARLADAGLNIENPAGYVGDPKVRLFPKPGELNRSIKVAVECVTCHDVHNEGSPNAVGPYAYKYPFLSVTSAGSYLCLQCHNK